MSMDNTIVGAVTGTGADVNTYRSLEVVTETDAWTNAANVGAIRAFSENDQGVITGVARLASMEVDIDYRGRVSQDIQLDEYSYSAAAQYTGKHTSLATTFTNGFVAGNFTSNSANASGSAAGSFSGIQTYASFPAIGTHTLSFDQEVAFSANCPTNNFVEFGGQTATISAAAPTDGVFFRLNSSGLQGIASYNGAETSTGIFPISSSNASPWQYTLNKRYQYIVYIGGVYAAFWMNDGTGAVLMGTIPLPAGQGRMCMSQSLRKFFQHRVTGGASGGALQASESGYSVRLGGSNIATVMSTMGNRIYGSYQALDGATQGSLANFANSANPTAAAPTNTTAALGTGLGGQFWETDTLAVTTDGIIQSFQVPTATVNARGARLVVRGVKIQSFIQTALTGGGYNAVWSLAFGHTAVSLATAEGTATKAPRRIPLGVQSVASGAAALLMLQDVVIDFGDAPVFVNPGEFVQCVKKKVGAAPTAGTVAHNITFIYGWE